MSGATARARSLLQRGAWIDLASRDGTYALRLGTDRRCRAAMALNEATFRSLVEAPGLKARPGGGWVLRPTVTDVFTLAFGSPGRIEGERAIMMADGRMTLHRANLGESPIAWLARRKDPGGNPWLTPAQVAAGDRLQREAEIAQAGSSLTMRWDALPRSGGGSSARIEPGDRAINAERRVVAALAACGTRHRPILEAVCVRGSALQLAERELGLARRQGKVWLGEALTRLAAHYGIG